MTNVGHAFTDCHASQPPLIAVLRPVGNLQGLATYLVEAPINPGCQRILALASLVNDCGLASRFVRDRMQNNALTEQPLRFWLKHACRYKKPDGPTIRMIVAPIQTATGSDAGELL
jgi:hypothetical protein